jgi:putative FmdB family regulatory protein
MPIYEYRCDDCGTKFEKLVRRAAETAELTCPECGQPHLSQELSRFAAHSAGAKGEAAMPQCASGMCPTPGLCGRN